MPQKNFGRPVEWALVCCKRRRLYVPGTFERQVLLAACRCGTTPGARLSCASWKHRYAPEFSGCMHLRQQEGTGCMAPCGQVDMQGKPWTDAGTPQ
jgi:hypothetical protein